jgi:YhcN/YlaJ family sporulation lipoprotein
MSPSLLRDTTHKENLADAKSTSVGSSLSYTYVDKKGCTKVKKFPMICFSLLLLAGCAPNKQASPPPAGQKNEIQRVQQTAPEPKRPQNSQATAKRLVALASRVPKVNSATAVVFGKVAIVGIDVDAKLDRARVGTIKYSVAEALREDPQGARALVTADPDIVQRLREMNADIRRGRPVAGFAEELADIAGRIIPQAPHREPERNQPQPNAR